MIKKLAKIQQELKAPKGQFNSFGKYNYRSCEDILEAVKPLLGDMVLTINDEMVEVGGRIYVRATVTLKDDDGVGLQATAFAREADSKKGMDAAQVTGAASSYARKYALNGLFLIDDTKDADHRDNAPPAPKKKANAKTANPTMPDDVFITSSQSLIIRKAIDDKNVDIAKFLDYYGITEIESLPASKFSDAKKTLDGK